jgi:hypothetical protein
MSSHAVLILTNSQDVTSDYLCSKLAEAGIENCRFDTDFDCCNATFVYREGVPQLEWRGKRLRPDEISSVIYRRPKQIAVSSTIQDVPTREHTASEWSEAIEGFLAHIDEDRWLNHPSRNYMASHKVEQLTRAETHGLRVPETIVTNDRRAAEEFVCSHRDDAVVKPLSSGFIEREQGGFDTIIYTSPFRQSDIHLLREISDCPVLFQRRVPKVLDVRVTVVDQRSIAVGLRGSEPDGSQRLDIRRNNMSRVDYTVVEIPSPVLRGVQDLLSEYRLRFAALDFAVTETGEWFFLEINPNGQWAWLDLCASAGISAAFVEALRGGTVE